MSNPNIPNITPTISLSVGQTVPLLLSSIALEELALAHLLNAEAEKLQFVLGTLPPASTTFSPAVVSVTDLLAVDSSVQRTLRDVIKKEMLLEFKFDNTLELIATIASSPTAFLFVSNFDGNTVTIFDITNRTSPIFLREFGADHLNGPTGLAITGTTLYVSNFNNSLVSIYDISTPADPVFVTNFGGVGELNGPTGLVVTGTDLFVANQSNSTVETYDIAVPHSPIRFGEFGAGQLNGPTGLAIKGTTLYVSNQFGNTIDTYDVADLDTVTHLGNFGTGELNGPTGLAITGNILYVDNFNNSRAEVYDIFPPSPIRINEFGIGELNGPQGMVIYPPGPIFPPNPCYVANRNNNTVNIYDITVPPSPVRVGQISSHLRAPVGLAVFVPPNPI